MMNIASREMDRDVETSAESTLSNSLDVESSDSKLDECGVWTNEKHNSYIEYLENSFVKQLYSLLGGETHRLSRTRGIQYNARKSAGQFTVLQNGLCQKVNFGNRQACPKSSSEFCFEKSSLRSSPEKLKGTHTMGTTVQGDVYCNEKTKHCSLGIRVGHGNPSQSAAEASGQNFREEEEKGCDSEVSVKRRREANDDNNSSINDQVVPVRMVKKPRMSSL